jgi:hypothetical protein
LSPATRKQKHGLQIEAAEHAINGSGSTSGQPADAGVGLLTRCYAYGREGKSLQKWRRRQQRKNKEFGFLFPGASPIVPSVCGIRVAVQGAEARRSKRED